MKNSFVSAEDELHEFVMAWAEKHKSPSVGTFMNIKLVRVSTAVHVLVSPPLLIDIKSVRAVSVNEMELSVRAANVLYNGNISTIGELMDRTRKDLERIRCCGKVAIKELQEKLEWFGVVVDWYR